MPEWINIALVSDFPPGDTRLEEINGAMVAICNVDGEYLAIEDRCSHADAALLGSGLDTAELLEGATIICPHHGARICLRTGAALSPPAYEPVAVYPVRVVDGMVQVREPQQD